MFPDQLENGENALGGFLVVVGLIGGEDVLVELPHLLIQGVYGVAEREPLSVDLLKKITWWVCMLSTVRMPK